MLLQQPEIIRPSWAQQARVPATEYLAHGFTHALAPAPPTQYPAGTRTATGSTAMMPSDLMSEIVPPSFQAQKKGGGGLFGICKPERHDTEDVPSTSSMRLSTATSSSGSVADNASQRGVDECGSECAPPPKASSTNEAPLSSYGSDSWDLHSRNIANAREGPTGCPAHIQADNPGFSSVAPSPLMLYYYDESAPNNILLDNDVKEHPLDNAKKQIKNFWTCTRDEDEAHAVVGDKYSDAVKSRGNHPMIQPATNSTNTTAMSSSADFTDPYSSAGAAPLRAPRSGCCGGPVDDDVSSSSGIYSSSAESSYIESSLSTASSITENQSRTGRAGRSPPQMIQTQDEIEMIRGSVRRVTQPQAEVVPRGSRNGTASVRSRTTAPTMRTQQKSGRCCQQAKDYESLYSGYSSSAVSVEEGVTKFSKALPQIYLSAPSPVKGTTHILPAAPQFHVEARKSTNTGSLASSHLQAPIKKPSAGWCKGGPKADDSDVSAYCSSAGSDVSRHTANRFQRSAHSAPAGAGMTKVMCPKCDGKGFLLVDGRPPQQQKAKKCGCCSKPPSSHASDVASSTGRSAARPVAAGSEVPRQATRQSTPGTASTGAGARGKKGGCCCPADEGVHSIKSAESEIASAYAPAAGGHQARDSQTLSVSDKPERPPSSVPSRQQSMASSAYMSSSASESSSSVKPVARKPAREQDLSYEVHKMFFNAEDGTKDTSNMENPSYSVSYKHYPIICYDVVRPSVQEDFFRTRIAPVRQ